MKYLFILFFGVLGLETAFSQECGGGFFLLNITFDEEEYQPIDYQVFTIEKTKETNSCVTFIKKEAFTDLGKIQKFEETIKSEYLLENLKKKFANNSFIFNTLELLNKPVLIKIRTEKADFYLLGNFFGGCYESASVHLGQSPKIIEASCELK